MSCHVVTALQNVFEQMCPQDIKDAQLTCVIAVFNGRISPTHKKYANEIYIKTGVNRVVSEV
jgi:hypothetical protein